MRPFYSPAVIWTLLVFLAACDHPFLDTKNAGPRLQLSFNTGWKFLQDEMEGASQPGFDDSRWRRLNLPHDWSTEGEFSRDHPSTPGGGALPGGIGWYRNTFTIPEGRTGDRVFVEFDGIYQNSEVWINGHSLGTRPNGYISFRYELTPYIEGDGKANTLAVRVDNSLQPNSRWYSGSGIYRDARLVFTRPVYVGHRGVFVTTPEVSDRSATVRISTTVHNSLDTPVPALVTSKVQDPSGRLVAEGTSEGTYGNGSVITLEEEMRIDEPLLWSVEEPVLYTLVTEIRTGDTLVDRVETPFGIRWFEFDPELGFSLNGVPVKMKGVCNHHDLGCLGAAAYPRAIERQLEMLREMGCNAIRTSHNPPSPVLLDLCDRMGFLVMDETFDMWELKKVDHDYHLHWEEWHERDLADHIRRDRNHPSVILWSIGNEILEQWDPSGREKALHLAGIVRGLDDSRPVISGCNFASPDNHILSSGATDI
ncbi:MAG: glycoside hydrolase family 2 protein, partial [Bacteroidetes bacterium]